MLGQTTTHATLLARLAKGDDPDAWTEFNARYGELIRSFAARRGLQASDRDDLAQEVLLALNANLPAFQYDPAKGRFRGYLKTIALRTISRKLCQKRGMTAQEQIEQAASHDLADPAAEEHWEAEWRQYHLRSAMRAIRNEFNETDLAAFDAYAGHGRDAAQVAADLGITPDAVYQAKSRILKRLRILIAQQSEEEG
ncbi:MAG: sigma-70 family RNA polymerase sigma factor [Phycisphaerales bacterium]|nr:sigma-70 family RNA polymerase sigma factor [Phycisphaerales bacterium]